MTTNTSRSFLRTFFASIFALPAVAKLRAEPTVHGSLQQMNMLANIRRLEIQKRIKQAKLFGDTPHAFKPQIDRTVFNLKEEDAAFVEKNRLRFGIVDGKMQRL